jgi:diguanylate cyclase (GGDEF)-like protein/PAS domain S-box-containing protein
MERILEQKREWRREANPVACPVSLVRILVLLALLLVVPSNAWALDPIELDGTEKRIELTDKGLAIEGRGDQLQIDTAPGADGISRRMSVRATTPRSDPNWIVFALRNSSDKPIDRWITVQRYSLIGSGVIWPDLDARRLEALTPSVGFLPQRIENDRADIFKITVDPGQTITYAAEMSTTRHARIYLWQPLEYELHIRERRLFNGIMLGITALLGIFLTAVFAANHKLIFPSAALVTWCVLIYLCVDFGFWHKLLQISAENNAVYRAAAEASMATSLVIFLHTFLRLGNWFGFVRMLSGVLIVSHLALVFVALIDPRLAATFARLSFATTGGIGALLILFLALRGQDRALSLMPTWLLFLVWLFGATMTITGKLNGDLVVSGLIAGLVLITVLIGFTVTQFAFRTVDPHYGAAPSEQQLRSLAVEGAAAAVWEWHARREEIKVGAVAEAALGLNEGELSTKVKDFIRHMHPADQERFNVLLWSIQNANGGEIRTNFRMRHADNSYRWFELEAASVPSSDRRTLRCVGLLRDVTDQKRAQARLMHDAVNCSLTGLPNRELFIDRVKAAIARVPVEPDLRPTVLFIDLDKFKSVNSSFGLLVGDSLLLTVSRRLSRYLSPMDTVARIGGDRFAMLILSINDPEELARLAESIRRSLRSPVKMAGQDIVLTGAIGIAVHDAENGGEALDLLRDAEVAMFRAKRGGADQIEIFRPDMRDDRDDRIAIEMELRRAIERRQIKVLYQPVIYLPTEELAGFEAQARWQHPRHGLLKPEEFISVAEEGDLAVKLGNYVLGEAVAEAARWQKVLPRLKNPLFVSINVSTRQIFRQDLVHEVRHVMGRAVLPEGVLRLEVAESLVMENPERAVEVLDALSATGIGLSIDNFGSGYSSLAYLERFPFDTIKIDRHLVQSSVAGERGGPAIVRSIVALAQELDKKIVAEGVEAAEDVAFLRSIGCQFAQGYYYGEAMSEKEVGDLLKIVRKSERKLHRRGLFRSALQRGNKRGEGEAAPDKAARPEVDREDRLENGRVDPQPVARSPQAPSLPAQQPAPPRALPEFVSHPPAQVPGASSAVPPRTANPASYPLQPPPGGNGEARPPFPHGSSAATASREGAMENRTRGLERVPPTMPPTEPLRRPHSPPQAGRQPPASPPAAIPGPPPVMPAASAGGEPPGLQRPPATLGPQPPNNELPSGPRAAPGTPETGRMPPSATQPPMSGGERNAPPPRQAPPPAPTNLRPDAPTPRSAEPQRPPAQRAPGPVPLRPANETGSGPAKAPPATKPKPANADFSTLPPSIAESLARLAGNDPARPSRHTDRARGDDEKDQPPPKAGGGGLAPGE